VAEVTVPGACYYLSPPVLSPPLPAEPWARGSWGASAFASRAQVWALLADPSQAHRLLQLGISKKEKVKREGKEEKPLLGDGDR